MNQRIFIRNWIDSIIVSPPGTITTGSSSISKYRNWETDGIVCKYKHFTVVKYIHGIFLILNDYKWISQILASEYKKFSIILHDFSEFESKYQFALSRFEECAENNYFLNKEIFQIVHNCNYIFKNKYLNYCKSLNYRKFMQVASKHRSRNIDSKHFVLKGLWYERTFVSREGK